MISVLSFGYLYWSSIIFHNPDLKWNIVQQCTILSSKKWHNKVTFAHLVLQISGNVTEYRETWDVQDKSVKHRRKDVTLCDIQMSHWVWHICNTRQRNTVAQKCGTGWDANVSETDDKRRELLLSPGCHICSWSSLCNRYADEDGDEDVGEDVDDMVTRMVTTASQRWGRGSIRPSPPWLSPRPKPAPHLPRRPVAKVSWSWLEWISGSWCLRWCVFLPVDDVNPMPAKYPEVMLYKKFHLYT